MPELSTNELADARPGGEAAFTYAGFWLRAAASAVDSIVVIVLAAMGEAIAHQLRPASALGSLTFALSSWLYYTLTESSRLQGTIGKVLFGLRVTDADGNRISFARANRRYWSKLLSMLSLSVGYLMAAFTARRQALHDKVARTNVVKFRV